MTLQTCKLSDPARQRGPGTGAFNCRVYSNAKKCFKKRQKGKFLSIGVTNRIGQDIRCVLYTGFFSFYLNKTI